MNRSFDLLEQMVIALLFVDKDYSTLLLAMEIQLKIKASSQSIHLNWVILFIQILKLNK